MLSDQNYINNIIEETFFNYWVSENTLEKARKELLNNLYQAGFTIIKIKQQ